ncbi:MAG: glycosyltransferase family 39 protein [Parcubacteria group bacterium]
MLSFTQEIKAFLQRQWLRYALVGIILSTMGALQVVSMLQETQTTDEGVHLAAGYSYLVTGDFRLNEEHPPLIKMLAGVGVLLTRPNISFDAPAWQQADSWEFPRQLLYYSGNDADRILLFARIPMMLVSMGLGLLIYFVGRRIGGELAGFIALGWYAFDPNFLAHGRYVTTDVGAALAYLATMFMLLRLLEQWSRRRLVGFSIVFALAQMTKFSAIFLWVLIIVIPIAWLLTLHKERPIMRFVCRRVGALIGWAALGTAIITMLFYFGQVRYGHDDYHMQEYLVERDELIAAGQLEDQHELVQVAAEWSDRETFTDRFIMRVLYDTPIPAWSYFKGFTKLFVHNVTGHSAYLLGEFSRHGVWQYFPIAFFAKTPAVTFSLVVVILALVFTPLRKRWKVFSNSWLAMLGLAGSLYFAWSMTSGLNLGVRHIFPVYPVLFILIGTLLAACWRQGNRWLKLTVIAFALLYGFSSFASFPTYTTYFSEFVGGTNNGHRILSDSNLDWGQDLKRLGTYLNDESITDVCLSYFGQAWMSYYGLEYPPVPTNNEPHGSDDVNCVVAMSKSHMFSEDGKYSWLAAYRPDHDVGGSIWIYDFREDRAPAKSSSFN